MEEEVDDPADSNYAPSNCSGDSSTCVSPSVVSEEIPLLPGLSQGQRADGPTSNGEVAHTNNGEKRAWDRKNICFFCEKPQLKMARHLQTHHGKEPEVKKAYLLEKGSKERLAALHALQLKGNYAHNIKIKCGMKEGVLIPCRRVTKEKKAEDFLACEYCRGFFFRKTLWRHKRHCARENGAQSHGRVQRQAQSLVPARPGISDGLQRVLDSMVFDEVSIICKTDDVIVKFGEKLVMRVGTERHNVSYVSCKMRELGRLLVVLREQEPNAQLRDFFVPEKFTVLTAAVRELCSFSTGENKYETPSLALKIGHSISKCAGIVKAKKIERGEDVEPVTRFLELKRLEWTDEISRRALTTLTGGKWNRPELLPITEDLKKLQMCLDSAIASKKAELEASPSPRSYKEFSEALLSRIILFNRRRQGEAGRMTVEGYHQCHKANPQDAIGHSLSPLEKHLADTLTRVVIKGKRGRGVPVLLTAEVKDGIDTLLAKREECGVDEDCPYIFVNTMSSDKRAMLGCVALKKYVTQCGAKSPEAITSTNLRKHIATLSQIMNLKENELDQLANFLGHDIRVHREFYRLPDATVQIAKISKVLMAMENDAAKCNGKSLDQLDTSDHEASDVDEDNERSDKRKPDGDGRLGGAEGSPAAKKKKKSHDHEAPKGAAGQPAANRKKTPWTSGEKAAGMRQLGDCIRKMVVPGQARCLDAIKEEPDLSRRSWRDVKYHVHNMLVAKRRRAKSE